MIRRLLHRPDGSLRHGRLIVLLAATICLAMFGTALIWLAPKISDSDLVRGAWVMFAVVALKFPLIAVLWSFIRRNAEWPGRPVTWNEVELAEILAHMASEAERVDRLPDGEERLAYLSREAWNVADHVGGDDKVDALTVALGIDERLMARRSQGATG